MYVCVCVYIYGFKFHIGMEMTVQYNGHADKPT
jgi:hypothetical protein